MTVLCCATCAYPTHTLRVTSAKASVCSSSRVSVSQLHASDSSFVPEVNKAVDSLSKEFREVDNLVARNSVRVLKAFQRVKVGSHVIFADVTFIDGSTSELSCDGPLREPSSVF